MKQRFKKFVSKVYSYMGKPEMLTLPSSLAYYFFLALVPIASFILLIATNLNLSTNYLANFFEKNFSTEIVELITPMITNQSFSIGYIIYLIVTFYIVSNGANAIIIASNAVFGLNNKNFFHRRLKAFGLTLVIFVLFTFLLIVPVFGEQLINILISIGFDNALTDILQMIYPVLRIPLSLLVIYFAIKWIYIIAPDEKLKSKYVTKGAIFTTIGWIIATFTYSYYIKHFAKYNLYYAGLSIIVTLLIWLYFLAFIFVLGLSMNYQNTEEQIEKTNTIKLKELEEKVKASKNN